MQRKTPLLLEDIRDAASFVRAAVAGKSIDEYRQDRLLRQAVERNFEIIGEAMNRLTRLDPEIADGIQSASRIVAFRNLLIHGYDIIDHEHVWTVIHEHLPSLEKTVTDLLSQWCEGPSEEDFAG